jgi:hypothetical protein
MEGAAMSALEVELAYYKRHRATFLAKYLGQYLIIKGEKEYGAYSSEGLAYGIGIGEFGNVAFLIQPVEKEEEVARIPALMVGVVNANSD